MKIFFQDIDQGKCLGWPVTIYGPTSFELHIKNILKNWAV